MRNPLENPGHNIPLVVGGILNSTLCTWLKELGFEDFVHAKLTINSIAPNEIAQSAEYIRREYGNAPYIFSVGLFADKTLVAAGLAHGALPSTSTEDKIEIQTAIQNCKNYLRRGTYETRTPNNCG